MSLQELSQDPFDSDEFIERLAWRSAPGRGRDLSAGAGSAGGSSRSSAEAEFDPMALHAAFTGMIATLKEEEKQVDRQAQRLEAVCIEGERTHWKAVKDLQKKNLLAFQKFQELDERINFVATKVVHLGDQLESINIPRSRNAEALRLIRYINGFLQPGHIPDDIFKSETQLEEAADLIQKLHAIAQELPTADDRVMRAVKMITDTYIMIDKRLVDKFLAAYRVGDIAEMKRVSNWLLNFKGYNEVVDKFIDESQKEAFHKGTVFETIPSLCLETTELVKEVFHNPEMVMTKFVTNLYHGKLNKYLTEKLSDRSDMGSYLKTLSELYASTKRLSESLSEKLHFGSDTGFLNQLTNKNMFGQYLATYFELELQFLKERSASVLQRYYESRGHQKKAIHSGGIHSLKREMQVRMHINLASDNQKAEVFLSQEVSVSLLQEYKLAYQRIVILCKEDDVPGNAKKVFDIMKQYLCQEFMEYAVDFALQACPLPEPSSEPSLHFLEVISDVSTVIHLVEKQYVDSVLPVVTSPELLAECEKIKTIFTEQLERKSNQGLIRTLQAIDGWTKHLLATYQKKSDFRPTEEGEMTPQLAHTDACARVVQYMTETIDQVVMRVDGKNRGGILDDLAIHFHRMVYDHLLNFQYNETGGMQAICDVNEYRNCVKENAQSRTVHLFDILHGLCNLFLIAPANLRQVSTDEPLATLDASIISSFVQLRTDYKSAKLSILFR